MSVAEQGKAQGQSHSTEQRSTNSALQTSDVPQSYTQISSSPRVLALPDLTPSVSGAGLIGTPPLQLGFSAACPVPAGSWNVPHHFRLLVLPPLSSTSPRLLLMLHRTARGWGGYKEETAATPPKLPGAFQAGTFRKRPALPGCSPTRSFPQPAGRQQPSAPVCCPPRSSAWLLVSQAEQSRALQQPAWLPWLSPCATRTSTFSSRSAPVLHAPHGSLPQSKFRLSECQAARLPTKKKQNKVSCKNTLLR